MGKSIKIFKKNGVKYAHLIFTRFNHKWYDKKRLDVSGNSVLDDEWMQNRCELFEKYYLPSITKQSNKNFNVLLLFDINTDKKYINKYKDIPNINIIYIPHKEFLSYWLSKKDIDVLITSRIDNDDAITLDYVELIQQQALMKPEVEQLIDFSGHQLIETDYRVVPIYQNVANSPFLSVSSNKKQGFRHCFLNEHSYMHQFFKNIKKYKDKSYFLQVIHERNLGNTRAGIGYVNPKITNNFKHIFDL